MVNSSIDIAQWKVQYWAQLLKETEDKVRFIQSELTLAQDNYMELINHE